MYVLIKNNNNSSSLDIWFIMRHAWVTASKLLSICDVPQGTIQPCKGVRPILSQLAHSSSSSSWWSAANDVSGIIHENETAVRKKKPLTRGGDRRERYLLFPTDLTLCECLQAQHQHAPEKMRRAEHSAPWPKKVVPTYHVRNACSLGNWNFND